MSTKPTIKKSIQIPAACPTCLSTKNLGLLPGSETVTRYTAGEIDNFSYKKVTWSRRICECGQIVATRTYSR